MKKGLEQVAVIGLGRFGMQVIRQLEKYDCEVLAIDEDEALVEEAVPYVTKAMQVNALDQDVLLATGIQDFDTVIIGIGENLESSLMIALTLKDIGIPRIIAKAKDEKHVKLLEMIGVNQIVQPEIDSANKLVSSLTTKYIKDKLALGKDHSLLEITAPKAWVSKSFGELALRQKYSFNVVCVKRGEEVVFPTASTEVLESDTLMIMASDKNLESLSKLY
jgi:trk system potassium uptake protein TrkA